MHREEKMARQTEWEKEWKRKKERRHEERWESVSVMCMLNYIILCLCTSCTAACFFLAIPNLQHSAISALTPPDWATRESTTSARSCTMLETRKRFFLSARCSESLVWDSLPLPSWRLRANKNQRRRMHLTQSIHTSVKYDIIAHTLSTSSLCPQTRQGCFSTTASVLQTTQTWELFLAWVPIQSH